MKVLSGKQAQDVIASWVTSIPDEHRRSEFYPVGFDPTAEMLRAVA